MQRPPFSGLVASALLLISQPPLPAAAEEEEEKVLPAWTSTLQCLAPLAREARSGEGELSLDQVFFDGPFARPGDPLFPPAFSLPESAAPSGEARRALSLGFTSLLTLDDREAERWFREALFHHPDNALAWLGLHLAVPDNPRRADAFLRAAEERAGSLDEANRRWLSLQSGLAGAIDPNEREKARTALSAFALEELAEDPANAVTAAMCLRQEFLSALRTGSPPGRSELFDALRDRAPDLALSRYAHFRPLSAPKPEFPPPPSGTVVPAVLALEAARALDSGSPGESIAARKRSLEAERERLERIGHLMPGAALNLGKTAAALARQLRNAGREDEADDLLGDLLRLPADPYAIGAKWRRLTRDRSVPVAARRERVRAWMRAGEWEKIAAMPTGFRHLDKAEVYAWRSVAAAESGEGDPYLWLTLLQRERESRELTETVEQYLSWKMGEIETPPEADLPGVPASFFSETRKAGEEKADAAPANAFPAPGDPAPAFPPLHREPEDFALPDWRGEKRSLAEFRGQPVVVIFFLGGGCLHCVEQLVAFGPWAEKFREAGIEMLSVSTDPVEVLEATLSDEQVRAENFPIPVVSDHGLGVFKKWRTYDEFDGRALHGTFLLDEEGRIIWEERGNTPYMHPDFLLYEAKRLLDVANSE